MAEWEFDLSQITLQEFLILIYLADAGSMLALHHFSSLARKAGVDLDDVCVTQMPEILAEFIQQITEAQTRTGSAWPGIWGTIND